MRHHNHNRKLGLKQGKRRALLRSLARALISHDAITTSEAKAKELRPFVERLVARAKEKNQNSMRIATARLGGEESVKRLFSVIGPKYASRKGGYTRILKLSRRLSDGALMARIEFV